MKYELPSTELIVIEENNYLKFGEYLNDMQCDDTTNKLCLDDLEYVKKLLQENQQLKEQNKKEFADYIKFKKEQHDEYLEKVNKLIKEKQELKKQLEENKDKINWYENFEINKTIDKLRIKHNNQQKEFIKYLEDEIKFYKNRDTYIVADILGSYDLNDINLKLLEEILQKYKSIIGVLDDETN